MTEILVGSLDDGNGTTVVQPEVPSAMVQMQGFVASSSRRSEYGGYVIPEGRDRGNSVPTTSLRSEPDLDTIMPLPGTSYYHGRSQTVGGGGGGSDSDSDGGEGAGNTSFTSVEVCEFYLRTLWFISEGSLPPAC